MSDTVRQQAEREAAASRVMARADRLAALSETADALTRVYLSPEHLQANQLVGQWMQAAGMMVWQDSVGNICGRYEGVQEGAPAVLLGSHLDTVRNAGRYDGMLGVLAASASYIAVPAAMRVSVPEADPALPLAASLGVTFPFNVTFGIPLYYALAQRLVG